MAPDLPLCSQMDLHHYCKCDTAKFLFWHISDISLHTLLILLCVKRNIQETNLSITWRDSSPEMVFGLVVSTWNPQIQPNCATQRRHRTIQYLPAIFLRPGLTPDLASECVLLSTQDCTLGVICGFFSLLTFNGVVTVGSHTWRKTKCLIYVTLWILICNKQRGGAKRYCWNISNGDSPFHKVITKLINVKLYSGTMFTKLSISNFYKKRKNNIRQWTMMKGRWRVEAAPGVPVGSVHRPGDYLWRQYMWIERWHIW